MRVLNDLMIDGVTMALAHESAGQALDHILVADIVATVTVANPSAKSFVSADVDVSTNEIEEEGHGFTTGVKVALTTDDALPAPLAAQDYYLIVTDAGHYQFASSQENALAGTAIDITDQGSGTHTVTPDTDIDGSIKLQKNDEPDTLPAIWVDIANSSQNFTDAGNLTWSLTDIGFREVRIVSEITSGTVVLSARINGKGA